MKKADLVQAMLDGADLGSKKKAAEVVDLFFSIITETLKKREDVGITGFGTFKAVKRAARKGVNPKTGEKINIPAAIVPKFKAGKLLKDAVK